MRYGLLFKLRFFFRNGFWPQDMHLAVVKWLDYWEEKTCGKES